MSKQVSVPLDAVLFGFVERAAERESRTVTGQIRHFIVEAMEHIGVPRCYLTRMCEEGLLIKVGYGRYRAGRFRAA
jgi:hypothetical protein